MRLSRLRGRKICERLQRRGEIWKGRHLLVRWQTGAPRHPSVTDPSRPAAYVGTLASARLDKSAVRRNRMRRRCREALRTVLLSIDHIPVPVQLLLIPRSSSLGASFADLQQDVRAFLARIHGTPAQTK
ncbi:MAG: hypothetical protein Greene041619_268 [Candidatus Peregrinibacteria bacterium Greene0416_19]|nr:MAG: hypothetical protein Greene041619_268 [Candidatus Peregrinibacteria bacterium Greene0416_19]